MISQQTSKVIDSLRFPMAVLVIICHSGFFSRPSGDEIEAWHSWHTFFGMQLFCSEVVPHVAVPLFMLFSGLLLFKNGNLTFNQYIQSITSRFRTLLIPYLIWNTLCFAVAVNDGSVQLTFIHWLQGLWDSSLWDSATPFSIELPGFPMNMPLWFLRDLMILILLSYPIGLILNLSRGWVLLLVAGLWFPGHDKYFGFGADSMFYFCLGAWIGIKQIDFVALLYKVRVLSYLFAVVMLIVDFYITYSLYLQHGELRFIWMPFNVFVVSMMIATINLSVDWQTTRLQTIFQRLSPTSFFLFASHIVFMYHCQRWLYGLFNPVTQIGNILFYWTFIILYIGVIILLFFSIKRYFPIATSILTGGRIRQALTK